MKGPRLLEIKTVRKFLERIAGKESVKVVEILLRSRKGLIDEDIAKKMGVRVTEVRTMLNRLHYRGIVNYSKSRDEKTGWFTYRWYVEKSNIVESIISELLEKIKKLEDELSMQESYTMFLCKKCEIELPFEIAAEYNFRCPECGGEMTCIDPKARKRVLRRELKKVKKEFEEIKKLK